LLNGSDIDIHCENYIDFDTYWNNAFYSACGQGHLSVAQWLHSLVVGGDIHCSECQQAVYAARRSGSLAVA
jgi:hypothetical protein